MPLNLTQKILLCSGGGLVATATVAHKFILPLLYTEEAGEDHNHDHQEGEESHPAQLPDYSSYEAENFLTVGSTTKQPKDLLAEYLETLSGAKSFSKIYVDQIIAALFNNINTLFSSSGTASQFNRQKNNDDSSLTGELDTGLASFEADLHNDKNIIKDVLLFGKSHADYKANKGPQQYRKSFIQKLKEHQKIFIDGSEAINYTSSTHDANKDKYEYSGVVTPPGSDDANSGDKKKLSLFNSKTTDKLLQEVSTIWTHIFDDWIATQRPQAIQKYSWNYASNNQTATYTLDEAAQALIKLPTQPNYYFPDFTDESDTKFKTFITKIEELDSQDLSTISDSTISSEVLELSALTGTSQANVANLLLHHRNADASEPAIADGQCAVAQPCLIKQGAPCAGAVGGSCPIITADKTCLTDKTILEAFCINKATQLKDPITAQGDFVYLNSPTAAPVSKWIIYKDLFGAHAIRRTPNITTTDVDKTLKAHLLSLELQRANNIGNKSTFNLNQTLNTYLEANYERLMLSYFLSKCAEGETLSQSKDHICCVKNCSDLSACCKGVAGQPSSDQLTTCKYHLLNTLVLILKEEQQREGLYLLRKNILKDYKPGPNSSLIVAAVSDAEKLKKAKRLSRGYAGTLPAAINWTKAEAKSDSPSDDQPSFKDKQLIPCLEHLYAGVTPVTPCPAVAAAASEVTDNINTLLACYKQNVDKLFKSNTGLATTPIAIFGNTVHKFTETEKLTYTKLSDLKNIPLDKLANALFTEGFRAEDISKLIISQIKKPYVKSYDWEKKQYKTDVADADFLNNATAVVEWVNKYSKSGASASNQASSSPSTKKIQELLTSAIKYVNNYDSALLERWPHIWNTFDHDIEDLDKLNAFLTNLDYEKHYLRSSTYHDDLSSEKLSMINQLVAGYSLINNGFEGYRDYLKKSLSRANGGYVFSVRFDPKLCTKTHAQALDKTNKEDWTVKKLGDTISNLFKGCDASDGASEHCVDLYDLYSISTITGDSSPASEYIEIPGFKGFIYSSSAATNNITNNQLPIGLWSKIYKQLEDNKTSGFIGSLPVSPSDSNPTYIHTEGNVYYFSYVIQVTQENVKTKQAFKEFLNKLTPDLVFKDIARIAKDFRYQQETDQDYLRIKQLWTHTESAAKQYELLTVGDARIKNTIHNRWFKK